MTMLPGNASGSMQNSRATPRSQNQRKGAMIVLDACDLCWWLQIVWFSAFTATRGGDNQAGPRAVAQYGGGFGKRPAGLGGRRPPGRGLPTHRPRAGATEGAKRNVDEPRPDRSQFLWRQAAIGQGARTISLREHVCLAHQPAQNIEIARSAQIEFGRKLAVPCIQFLVPKAGQMCASDLHHVSAMFGECASTGRSGKDAS